MIKIVVCMLLILTPLSASAEGELGIEFEKGSFDLLNTEVFSNPFTIFDQLLYSLGKETTKAAEGIRPITNDFTPKWKNSMDAARGTVEYSKKLSRVFVTFDLSVTSLNDPWREVCERHIRRAASDLGVAGLGSQGHSANYSNETWRKMFFQKHLGPKATVDETQVDSLQPFLDALVLMGRFAVDGKEKSPAYLRSCALDIKTDRMMYYEYKY